MACRDHCEHIVVFQGNVQPTEYLLSLVPVDGVGDNTLIRQSTVVEPTTSTLRLSIAPLQKNRVWEIALRPYECSLPISEKSILSKLNSYYMYISTFMLVRVTNKMIRYIINPCLHIKS